VSFDLQGILRLGDLDREILGARRRLRNSTSLAAPQRGRLEVAETELARMKEQTKLSQREVTRLEGEAKAKQAEIDKYSLAQNRAKTNEEYQTHVRSVERARGELGEIETRILEAYEAQEERDRADKKIAESLTGLKRELQEANGRVKAEEDLCHTDLTKLEEERARATSSLSQDLLQLYQRLLDKTGDSAVALVVDEICQGCYMKVRPEQISQVRGGKELVICFTCGRMLYTDRV